MRHQLTERQKVASKHIHNMSECQRDTFQQLEDMKKSPTEVFADLGRKYHKDMVGRYKCHLRALSNVSKVAAIEAMALGIRHDQPEKVLSVLKNHISLFLRSEE